MMIVVVVVVVVVRRRRRRVVMMMMMMAVFRWRPGRRGVVAAADVLHVRGFQHHLLVVVLLLLHLLLLLFLVRAAKIGCHVILFRFLQMMSTAVH